MQFSPGESGNPDGRPLEPCNLTDCNFVEIIELYKEGGSDGEVKGFICTIRGKFSNDLWARWLKDEVLFSETIKIGRMLSQRWWEANGRVNLHSETFNSTLWYMNMKNRFRDDWKDKIDSESTINNKGTITLLTPDLPATAEFLSRFTSGAPETSS